MAKYKVVERSYINGRIVEPGTEVEVDFADDGQPGPNLEALDAVAPKSKRKSKDVPPAGDADPAA